MTDPPLIVVALGGNALSPPGGDGSFAVERAAVDVATAELASLARDTRLLIVHGNGTQVGRLLGAPGLGDPASLDVHVAQTQGELGYLISQGLDAHLGTSACVALMTRVLVDGADPAFQVPSKPIGPLLSARPSDAPVVELEEGRWRQLVASPRPRAVVEEPAIVSLLRDHHVIAGGGGGVALADGSGGRIPVPAVVDKDWVATMLAIHLDASQLLFVTNVPTVTRGFRTDAEQPIHELGLGEAEMLLTEGQFAPGSMQPKIESAVDYVRATGRIAFIAGIGGVAAALGGKGGTQIAPH
jgi:carbamate kinase